MSGATSNDGDEVNIGEGCKKVVFSKRKIVRVWEAGVMMVSNVSLKNLLLSLGIFLAILNRQHLSDIIRATQLIKVLRGGVHDTLGFLPQDHGVAELSCDLEQDVNPAPRA